MTEWERFFAWRPIRVGRRIGWLRFMERSWAYFQVLNDDPFIQPPTRVYRFPRRDKP